MHNANQKTAGKGKKVRGGFKTSGFAEMFEFGGQGMDPFRIVLCKRNTACDLEQGHRGFCGKKDILTREDVDVILADWRAGRIPDKFPDSREFAS